MLNTKFILTQNKIVISEPTLEKYRVEMIENEISEFRPRFLFEYQRKYLPETQAEYSYNIFRLGSPDFNTDG